MENSTETKVYINQLRSLADCGGPQQIAGIFLKLVDCIALDGLPPDKAKQQALHLIKNVPRTPGIIEGLSIADQRLKARTNANINEMLKAGGLLRF